MGFGVSVCLERHVGSWAKDGTSEFVGRGFFAGSETIRSRAISDSSRQQARQSMARARLSGQVRLLYWNERERKSSWLPSSVLQGCDCTGIGIVHFT